MDYPQAGDPAPPVWGGGFELLIETTLMKEPLQLALSIVQDSSIVVMMY
jgi:hypothetical protein